MKEKIWIVEMQANDGSWFAAYIGDAILAYNNFYFAHRSKRMHYRHLKNIAPKIWSKKRLRVRAWYAPEEVICHT